MNLQSQLTALGHDRLISPLSSAPNSPVSLPKELEKAGEYEQRTKLWVSSGRSRPKPRNLKDLERRTKAKSYFGLAL